MHQNKRWIVAIALLPSLYSNRNTPAEIMPMLADAPPATAPATGPATESLEGGILFTPPAGWTRAEVFKKGLSIAYTTPKDATVTAVMLVNVDPLDSSLPKSTATKIGEQKIAQIKANAVKNGSELLAGPTMQPDPDLYLRIYTRMKTNGKVTEQLQLYRVIETKLVAVSVSANATEEEAKPVFGEAETVLASIHSRTAAEVVPKAPGKPIEMATAMLSLPAVKLKAKRPAGWNVLPTQATSGLVLTYRDPGDAKTQVFLTVKPLSADDKKNVKLRTAAAEALAKESLDLVKIDDTQTAAGTDPVVDKRYILKGRTKFKTDGGEFEAITRELAVGDTMVSVTSVAPTAQMETIDKLADTIATSIRVERVTAEKP